MNSTPGPQERESADNQDDKQDDKQDDQDEEPEELVLDVDQVLKLLDSQAAGIHEEIRTVAEVYEQEGQLPVSEVNSIRTEVMEVQSTVEEYLAANCEGTRAWVHADELVPRERRDALRGGA